MARVELTSHLARHLACPSSVVAGGTVREVLEAVFATQPRLRSYLLDDQGALRKHVVVFLDGERVRDRAGLSDQVTETSEVVVMQALSGG